MTKINWQEELLRLDKKPAAIPVYLCHGEKRIDGYLRAIPLPKEQAAVNQLF